MSYEAFLDITPGEFYLALRYEGERKKDEVDAMVRIICETIREQTLLLYNIQLERKDRVSNPKKLMFFPWDEEDDDQTKEEMINTMKSISKGSFKRKSKK